MHNILKVSLVLVGMFLLTSSVVGQDLIARQAPIDRKLKAIDSIALQRQLEAEWGEMSLAEELYPSWENDDTHVYDKSTLPDNYQIDLRGFSMPTTNTRVTSNFGRRWGRAHKGIDVDVNVGDTIYAAFDGKVRIVKYQRGGYGNYIVLRHPNGLETIYAHLSKQMVEVDQEVRSGQPIGLGGNTGRSTGSHLHFETRLLGEALNPALLFDFRNQDVTADYYQYEKGKTNAIASNSAGSAAKYYKVRKGDTLSTIAKRYGIKLTQLCKLNGMTTRSKLSIGKVLRVS